MAQARRVVGRSRGRWVLGVVEIALAREQNAEGVDFWLLIAADGDRLVELFQSCDCVDELAIEQPLRFAFVTAAESQERDFPGLTGAVKRFFDSLAKGLR